MTKYEEIIKQKEKNKTTTDIDSIIKKYKMNVVDVKNLKQMIHNAELETSLVKAVGMNSPEMKAAKEEINDLKNKMANLEDALRSKDYWRDPDYKFLIEENAELQKRIIELEQEILEVKGDNKKLAQQISIMMERMRDADF
tara:strand:+ start:54 stop:476 length:423 start_codon:yes stop_codon:yes gene_type:complete